MVCCRCQAEGDLHQLPVIIGTASPLGRGLVEGTGVLPGRAVKVPTLGEEGGMQRDIAALVVVEAVVAVIVAAVVAIVVIGVRGVGAIAVTAGVITGVTDTRVRGTSLIIVEGRDRRLSGQEILLQDLELLLLDLLAEVGKVQSWILVRCQKKEN